MTSAATLQAPANTSIAQEIPSAFPFESKYMDVLGSKMHYIDEGAGDPIVFVHGNPTSSYLWRNIIPHVSGQGRCIAVDLIGMGKSDHPDIPYRYDDQYRYLCAFIDALNLDSKVTLVIHDWGSALGLRWAHDHEDQLRGVAFMEAMVKPMSISDMPGSLKIAFKMMRAPVLGWLMVSVANIFITKMLQDLTHAKLSPGAYAYYASAYPTIASRKAIRQWPCEVPLDGTPAGSQKVILAYREWLTKTKVPMLLFYVNNGVAIKGPELAWCRAEISNLEVIDLGDGKHFMQETHPTAIGEGISRWCAKL